VIHIIGLNDVIQHIKSTVDDTELLDRINAYRQEYGVS